MIRTVILSVYFDSVSTLPAPVLHSSAHRIKCCIHKCNVLVLTSVSLTYLYISNFHNNIYRKKFNVKKIWLFWLCLQLNKLQKSNNFIIPKKQMKQWQTHIKTSGKRVKCCHNDTEAMKTYVGEKAKSWYIYEERKKIKHQRTSINKMLTHTRSGMGTFHLFKKPMKYENIIFCYNDDIVFVQNYTKLDIFKRK